MNLKAFPMMIRVVLVLPNQLTQILEDPSNNHSLKIKNYPFLYSFSYQVPEIWDDESGAPLYLCSSVLRSVEILKHYSECLFAYCDERESFSIDLPTSLSMFVMFFSVVSFSQVSSSSSSSLSSFGNGGKSSSS